MSATGDAILGPPRRRLRFETPKISPTFDLRALMQPSHAVLAVPPLSLVHMGATPVIAEMADGTVLYVFKTDNDDNAVAYSAGVAPARESSSAPVANSGAISEVRGRQGRDRWDIGRVANVYFC